MTDLAQLGLSLEAKPMLDGLGQVDKALAKTAAAAEALQNKIKTATGQMAAAFSKVKDGGAEKQAASLEKMNFAIEHQAKAYRALLAVMREDAAIAKSAVAQRILLNSAFASATAEIDKATVAGAKNLAGLRSETAVTTSLAVAQGGLTASEKQLLDAKIRKNVVTKQYTDSVRAEITKATQQIAQSNAHVDAYRRETAAIKERNAALAAERKMQVELGRSIIAMQGRQNAAMGLSSAGKDLFAPFANDPKVLAASKQQVALSAEHTAALKREEAATKSLAAIEAARAKQAMAMRMQPILSTGSVGLPTKATSAFNQPVPLAYTPSGIASVDRMRESLARLRVEEAALHTARNAGAISHVEYVRGLKEITRQTNLAVAGNARARGVFRQTASAIASATFEITGAIYGLGAAAAILASPAAFGFKLLSTLEQTKLGMSAILISMGEINGQAIKLPVALKMAAGITQRLQENALKYGVNLEALANTTRSIMAPGLGSGLNIQQIEKIALAGSIAVKTIGLDARQSVQEIRDLVAGGIQAASSTLATALGITDKIIKGWKEAGTLYENLMSRLAGFQDTAILNAETLSGAWSIFVQKLQLAFANSTQFDNFKQKLIDLSNWIGKVNVNTGNFEFNPTIINSVTAYYEGFKATMDVLTEVGRVIALLSPVVQTLAVLFVNITYIVRTFIGEVKTMATQLVALAHLDFKGFKGIGAEWKEQAKAARIEVDRLSNSILGLKEAQAGGSKLMGKWGIGGKSPWEKVDPAFFVTGKLGAGGDSDKKAKGTVDPQIAFMAALRKEVETLGMGEEALKRYEISKTKLSASNRRLADSYVTTIFAFKAQQEAAKLANEEAQKAIEANEALIKSAEEKITETEKSIKQVQFETALLSMNTEERYRAIAANQLSENAYLEGNAALAERIVLLQKEQEYQSRLTSLLSGTQKAKTDEFMANIAAADRFFFDGGNMQQYEEMIKNITEGAKDNLKELDSFAENAAKNIQNSMAEFLFNPFDKGLKGMAQGFGQMMQKMIAEAVAADLARKLFGGLADQGKTQGTGWIGAGLDWLGGLLGLANGGAFGPGGVRAFASGGIMGASGGLLTRPTVFPMANGGIGLGGEAGVEAVMPLKRGSDGKLGVTASGGTRNNITVIVQGGQSAPDVRRAAGQGAREALNMLNGAKRYG